MDLEIQQSDLLSALALAANVIDRRSTMPVLTNVLLRATDDGLVCSATDMMLALTESVPSEVSSPGSLTLGVRHLYNVVRTLPPGPVQIRALDNAWAQIRAGRSEFKLMGLPSVDFPELPDPEGITFTPFEPLILDDLIQRTLFSVCQDESRVNINGALLESDGTRATMVSTDGHRLTKIGREVALPTLSGGGVIIPRKGLIEIRKVLARAREAAIGFSESQDYLFLRAGALVLSVKLNNVTFPPWRQVLPKKHERVAVVDRAEVSAALRQAVVMAPEKTSTVVLTLGQDEITLAADNPELGSIRLALSADVQGSAMTAGFNGAYLLETIDVCGSDKIRLEFQGDLDPVQILPVGEDDVDFSAVVMPMRI